MLRKIDNIYLGLDNIYLRLILLYNKQR